MGLLIRGASGSGKSRLAMALLERAGATSSIMRVTDEAQQISEPRPLDRCATALIGDDYLDLTCGQSSLKASPAKGLAGLMEVRGLGILAMPWCADTPIHLAVDLVPLAAMERLPANTTTTLAGYVLSQLNIPIGDLAHQLLLVRIALHTLVRKD